jgi:hypothetical protein
MPDDVGSDRVAPPGGEKIEGKVNLHVEHLFPAVFQGQAPPEAEALLGHIACAMAGYGCKGDK